MCVVYASLWGQPQAASEQQQVHVLLTHSVGVVSSSPGGQPQAAGDGDDDEDGDDSWHRLQSTSRDLLMSQITERT